jgi:hypothetical protein
MQEELKSLIFFNMQLFYFGISFFLLYGLLFNGKQCLLLDPCRASPVFNGP